MVIKPLYEGFIKHKRKMRVAGFMSGSGTNIRKILEHQNELGENSPYEMVCLFSNVSNLDKCKIKDIAEEFNLTYWINDLKTFYEQQGCKDRRDLNVRRQYDKITSNWLNNKNNNVDAVVLGGYMAIVTEEIFNKFITINVHPADLSIVNPISKKRKYTGDHAVKDAIIAAEKVLRSSVHLVTADVDGGPLIMISKPVKVQFAPGVTLDYLKKPENKLQLDEFSNNLQNKLKEVGDWVIFPLALEYIALGYIARDENNFLYYKGKMIPNGIQL